MRLLITGKTRSGKSTALHRILAHALSQPWAGVLLLDGKGTELLHYANVDGVTFYGADELDKWAAALQRLADELPGRYADLTARGLRQADPGDPRYLILADEVQRGTRSKDHGRQIKEALTLIAEQSAALSDVMILTVQREQHSVPPNVRVNVNANLRMLGLGYFHLQADGHPTRSGRVANVTPAEALHLIASQAAVALRAEPLRQHPEQSDGQAEASPLDPGHLPEVLGSQAVEPGRASVTLYLGRPGSGKTHSLLNHPNGHAVSRHRPEQRPELAEGPVEGANGATTRHVFTDLNQPHRQVLLAIIEQAGAVVPARASISDLVDIAGLALQAEPTLLALDNLDQASPKTLSTVRRLIDAAAEVALAATTPRTTAERRRIDPFIPRSEVCEIQPLTREQAQTLLNQHLPDDLVDHRATERRILDLARGHPATIVDLARRARRGTLREIRRFSAPQQQRRVNAAWLLLIPIIAMLLFIRADGYTLAAAATLLLMLARPFLYRSLRQT